MNWNDFVWFGVGLGVGVSLWLRSRSSSPSEPAAPPMRSPTPALQPSLQPLQLAYQLATEMSQFKGGFLARTSHELRSPLNGMIGMQQLILQDLCDSPEEEREFIAQANQSTLKMIKVLDTILDVARLEHGTLKMDLQPLQLVALLQSVYDLTSLQAADRNLKLRLTLPDPDLYVVADPRRLQQVLLYLIDTSITEMKGGCIHVSVQNVIETGYAQIWIDCDRPILLSEPIGLLDTPPEPGTVIPSPGLNLLTSQILLSLMQGKLTVVETAVGDGQTRLECRIPLVVPEPIA